MTEIHIHSEPVDCPKCEGGKMVQCLSSKVYKSKNQQEPHRVEEPSPAEFRHKPETSWKCVNCGHEIIPGVPVSEAHGGLTKTGDVK